MSNRPLGCSAEDARIEGLFVTKKLGIVPPRVEGKFECIDRTVYGNVRTSMTAYQVENQCLFEDHYAIKVNQTGLIYDACLTSVYSDMNSIVDTLLKKSPANPDILIPRTPPPPGGARPPQWQALRNEQPTGFGAGYMRL